MDIKYIKYLWSMAAATGAVTVTALFSSAFVNTSSEWYESLALPFYTPSDTFISFAWAAVYVLTIIILGRLINSRKNYSIQAMIVVLSLLYTLYTLFFFGFQSVLGGWVMQIPIIVSALYVLLRLLDEDKTGFILFTPVFCWLIFNFILGFNLIF